VTHSRVICGLGVSLIVKQQGLGQNNKRS